MSGELEVIAQRTVGFHGDDLVAIQTERGVHVPVKPICEALGIDWESQRQRIARDEVLNATACVIQAVGADGKRRDMVCLPDEMLHGWLFGVSVERIAPEHRERLIAYKRECYRVLHAAFTNAPSRLDALEARVATLESASAPSRRGAARPAQLADHHRALIAQLARIDGSVLHPQSQAIIALLADAADLPLRAVDMSQTLGCGGAGTRGYQQVKVRLHRMASKGLLERVWRGSYLLANRAEKKS